MLITGAPMIIFMYIVYCSKSQLHSKVSNKCCGCIVEAKTDVCCTCISSQNLLFEVRLKILICMYAV